MAFGRRRTARVALALLLLGVAIACAPHDTPKPAVSSAGERTTSTSVAAPCRATGSTMATTSVYRHVPGVDPNLLSLDHYEPRRPPGCGPAPIVVYVHGGGLRTGDKANRIADKAKLFTGEGWVFASVNYRLSPDPPDARAGQVRYPTHEEDVVAALAWLRAHAAEIGGDASRIYLVGHSSGAFLVSLLSTDLRFLGAAGMSAADVRCTVSLDTEYDVANQVAQGGAQESLYRNAFGDDPAVWSEGSPIRHTDPGPSRPKFLIYTQGLARRTEQARAFSAALNRGGTPASVLDVNPLSHERINRAVGAPGDTVVTPPLMSFLRSCP